MRNQKAFCLLTAVAVVLCAAPSAIAQTRNRSERIATVSFDRSEVRWQPHIEADHERIVLTISRPDGEVFRKAFKAGIAPKFKLSDENGNSLPDGHYNYELVVVPKLTDEVKAALAAAREEGETGKAMQELRRSSQLPVEAVVQSGSFLLGNGAVFAGGSEATGEPTGGRGGQGRISPQDVVNPDDVIVQGSLCVGLDCVNNESFGFDTIRLKENNTRIKFEDTSASAGFPSNDWQLTANDSASGGANKFSIEDITGAKVPFTITAGAATNSIFVDSTGRVGLRTSTPVLDLHANTSNTPAFRLEQNSSGGFTAQTWDIAGNEANFFVRDVTGGSLLPLRIRPGAPTSSIDIAASGNVGIGTGSPSEKLSIKKDANELLTARIENLTNGTSAAAIFRARANTAEIIVMGHADARTVSRWGVTLGGFAEIQQSTGVGLAIGPINANPLILGTNSQSRIFIAAGGNIGLGGQNSPTSPIHHANGATLSAGGVWTSVSSRASKTKILNLSTLDALRALQQLNPVTFEYKAEPGEKYVGFVAEDVPDLVAINGRKNLNAMDFVAVLTKVVQQQQKTIAELREKVVRLEMVQVKKAHRQRRR